MKVMSVKVPDHKSQKLNAMKTSILKRLLPLCTQLTMDDSDLKASF